MCSNCFVIVTLIGLPQDGAPTFLCSVTLMNDHGDVLC